MWYSELVGRFWNVTHFNQAGILPTINQQLGLRVYFVPIYIGIK